MARAAGVPPTDVPGLVLLLAQVAVEREAARGWKRLAMELLAELLGEQAWADALERDGGWRQD